MEGRCKFTNEGDPGDACVKVAVRHQITGQKVLSDEVCSGKLKSNEIRWVPITWTAFDPLVFCMGSDFKKDFAKECEATVLEEGAYE